MSFTTRFTIREKLSVATIVGLVVALIVLSLNIYKKGSDVVSEYQSNYSDCIGALSDCVADLDTCLIMTDKAIEIIMDRDKMIDDLMQQHEWQQSELNAKAHLLQIERTKVRGLSARVEYLENIIEENMPLVQALNALSKTGGN